jgi:hypothetical protein
VTHRRIVAASAVGVTVVALGLLIPLTSGRGPEMDEGAVVAYASRVLDGALPHRDFSTFYGPGNPFIVAGAFAVFGENVTTERVVGLVYRLLIVLALFAIALRLAGVLAGVLTALVAGTMLAKELVWAYATYGAIAFGALGLALATIGSASSGRRQHVLFLGAGLAGGAAVLIRPDFVLAVIAAVVPLLLYVSGRARIWYGAGFVALAGLYLPHAVIVGSDRLQRLIGDIRASGPGRTLPIPRPWGENWQLLTLGTFVVGCLIVLGALLWRRERRNIEGRILLGAGLLSAGLLPWTLSRPDGFHIRPYAVIPLSLLPAVVVLLGARRLAPGTRGRTALSIAVAALTLFVLADDLRPIGGNARELRGIRNAYRGFYDDDSRAASSAVIARLASLAGPGDSLFVGPQDLRRTNYGPTFMYFLLRDLEPASYYMEMNPGAANREGSGLAEDIGRADWLILTSEWDDWNEPNESMDYGPSEPNEVVRDDFCLRVERGQYRLYERCDRAA